MYVSVCVDDVCCVLCVKVPRWIGRVVTDFGGNNSKKQAKRLKRLKAAELKDFLLIYSKPILEALLQKNHPGHYDMLLYFHKACLIGSSYQISRSKDIPAMVDYMYKFLVQFEVLMGRHRCVPNLHMGLEMMINDVLAAGPNHSFWCFAFERLNGKLGDIHTNRRNICTTLLTTVLSYQRSRDKIRFFEGAHAHATLKSLNRVWGALNRETGPDFDQPVWNRLMEELTAEGYWTAVKAVGSTELGWDLKPALVVNSTTNLKKHQLVLSDKDHKQLLKYLRDGYLWWWPCLDETASLTVKTPLQCISDKLRLYHSMLGSTNNNNTSRHGAYVLVRMKGDKKKDQEVELPCAIEYYAEVRVIHTPQKLSSERLNARRPGKSGAARARTKNLLEQEDKFIEYTRKWQKEAGREKGKECEETVLVARAHFFTKVEVEDPLYTSPRTNCLGETIYDYEVEFKAPPVWIKINSIVAQFIPYYHTVELSNMVDNLGGGGKGNRKRKTNIEKRTTEKQVMSVCRVPLKVFV